MAPGKSCGVMRSMVLYSGLVMSEGGAFSPGSGASLNRLRVADELAELPDQLIDGMSGEHSHIQVGRGSRGSHCFGIRR